MIRKTITSVWLLVTCLLITVNCFAGTCCVRRLNAKVVALAGLSAEDARYLEGAVRSGMTYKGASEDHCPLRVEVNTRWHEYLVLCDLIIMPSDKKGGKYILPIPDGQVNYHIFTARLIDPKHGNAVVVGPEKVQWHGAVIDNVIHKPTGGRQELIKELILSMRPFSDKIYDYEHIEKRILSVTAEDILDTARRIFDHEYMKLAVVTNNDDERLEEKLPASINRG